MFGFKFYNRLFQGDKKAKELILKLDQENLFTTEITIFEVGYEFLNTNKTELDQFIKFIERIKIITTATLFSLEAARIKKELEIKGKTIDSMDLLIAGMMRSFGIKKIVARNAKHFESINKINVINY